MVKEKAAQEKQKIAALALDPIEKKPLYHFFPGSAILSVGFFGCNMHCPFCQNHEISQTTDQKQRGPAKYVSAQDLAELAHSYKDSGNIGLAYTYNEPLTHWRFVRETEERIREAGMKNVLVTNGSVPERIVDEVLPLTDAMNVDIKSFDRDYYAEVLKGNLDYVRAFIEKAAGSCHVELTTLIIPGENDSDSEMREITSWIRSIEERTGKAIPYHISRFFPRYRYSDRTPTPVETVYHLAEVAREKLKFVYPGNC